MVHLVSAQEQIFRRAHTRRTTHRLARAILKWRNGPKGRSMPTFLSWPFRLNCGTRYTPWSSPLLLKSLTLILRYSGFFTARKCWHCSPFAVRFTWKLVTASLVHTRSAYFLRTRGDILIPHDPFSLDYRRSIALQLPASSCVWVLAGMHRHVDGSSMMLWGSKTA